MHLPFALYRKIFRSCMYLLLIKSVIIVYVFRNTNRKPYFWSDHIESMVKKNRTKSQIITVCLLLIGFIASMIFINNNYDLYDRTIVQITDVQEINREDQVDTHGNKDEHVTQHIVGEVKKMDLIKEI